jgi:hypothetical protein
MNPNPIFREFIDFALAGAAIATLFAVMVWVVTVTAPVAAVFQ